MCKYKASNHNFCNALLLSFCCSNLLVQLRGVEQGVPSQMAKSNCCEAAHVTPQQWQTSVVQLHMLQEQTKPEILRISDGTSTGNVPSRA